MTAGGGRRINLILNAEANRALASICKTTGEGAQAAINRIILEKIRGKNI
jgi:hypothetical protein